MSDNTRTPWDDFISAVKPGDVNDKIIGMIYGHALGDAVGLQSEFKISGADMKIKFPYDRPIRDYPKCDWTDDTDHLILVMQSMIANNMKFNARDFAKRLKFWASNGFPELGDTTGLGLGGTTHMVLVHPKFLDEPERAANEIWVNAGRKIAPNGSLMRTSILGALPTLADIPKLAAALSSTTHADSRCAAACIFQSVALHGIIYAEIETADDVDDLMDACQDISRKYIAATYDIVPSKETRTRGTPRGFVDSRFSSREEEFLYWINMPYMCDIKALELDESVKIGFVLKCLGCSVYALQMIYLSKKYNTQISFKKFIVRIAAEAGDADTNCAVAGATLGAYLGYSKLPADWIAALPNRMWLNNIIMDFIDMLPAAK